MTESEFLARAEATLAAIETGLERLADESEADIECSRSGNVLEVEFAHGQSKIIINTQAPMQEIWVAARAGGFHYRYDGKDWINTRDGSELFASLSSMVAQQAGVAVNLTPR